MARIKFGADGWFARVGKGFTRESVIRFADAAGRTWSDTFPGAAVYVAYDTREHAAGAARLIAQVLSAYGMRVLVSDAPAPTPAVTWAVRHDLTSCGAVVVTGGHRSANWLGVKLRDDNGAPENGALSARIMRNMGWQPTTERGTFEEVDLIGPYLQGIASFVDTEAIRQTAPHVVVDGLFGAAQSRAAMLMGRIGAEVSEVHAAPDYTFMGMSPDPVEPWTEDCQNVCATTQAWAGFAFDCDADRLGASDGTGAFVSPNLIMPLVMEHLVQDRGLSGRVVSSSATSELVRRQARRLGCPYTVVPTGYQWVYGEMERGDVLLGGEASGAIGIPAHMPDRDPLLVAALLCEMMAQRKKTLADLIATMESQIGHMEYGRRNIALDTVSHGILCNLLPGLCPREVLGARPREVNHADGMRVSLDGGSWLLIRPSGNDRIMRIYAEAQTKETCERLLDFGEALVIENSVGHTREAIDLRF